MALAGLPARIFCDDHDCKNMGGRRAFENEKAGDKEEIRRVPTPNNAVLDEVYGWDV